MSDEISREVTKGCSTLSLSDAVILSPIYEMSRKETPGNAVLQIIEQLPDSCHGIFFDKFFDSDHTIYDYLQRIRGSDSIDIIVLLKRTEEVLDRFTRHGKIPSILSLDPTRRIASPTNQSALYAFQNDLILLNPKNRDVLGLFEDVTSFY